MRRSRPLPRFLSFRFDDGFIAGARTAAECIAPDHATFFLVADLVTAGARNHPEPLFSGRDFGSVPEWRALSSAGHDIQLHGRTHTDLRLLSPEEQKDEVVASLCFIREIHDGPYVFCHPYNRGVDLDFAALGISAAGFETRTSEQPILFNRLDSDLDLFALRSWAVRERHLERVLTELASLPEESWTILAFHSLDDEGHEPWTAEAFRFLVSSCRDLDLKVVTIARMVKELARPTAQDSRRD